MTFKAAFQAPARIAQQISKRLFQVSPVLAILALILFWFAFIVFVFCLGPICLAYDLNHLVPLATHQPLNVAWTNWAVLVCGFLGNRLVVPLALVVWLLVTIGVLS